MSVLGRDQADGGARELLAARVQEREVEEAGVAARAPGLAVLVEHQDGLGAVAELRAGAVVGVDAQPERLLVPRDGAGDAGDGQFHGAEAQRRREHGRGTGVRGCGRSHTSRVVPERGSGNGRAARMYGRPASCARAAAPGTPWAARRSGV